MILLEHRYFTNQVFIDQFIISFIYDRPSKVINKRQTTINIPEISRDPDKIDYECHKNIT